MGLSSTAWETEEPAKVRKGSLSSNPRPLAVTCAIASNTATEVPICFVACCHRCSLLLFLTFYICSSKQPDKSLFVSRMLWSLLFSLQLVLCIARTSCKALLQYKQRSPKLSLVTLAVIEIGLGTQSLKHRRGWRAWHPFCLLEEKAIASWLVSPLLP